MRILAIADIDDLRWKGGSGQADLLISCGDVSDPVILEAAEAYHCAQIYAVKGNHDFPAPFPPPIIDLHLHVESCGGMAFGGFNGSWKYKPRGHYLYGQEEAVDLLKGFPPVDIFVSHNSPRGIHDKEDEIHTGFDALRTYIQTAKPKLFIHGHQHLNIETVVMDTKVIGAYRHRLIEV